MCFYIHPKHPSKKIAKRDIICYKIIKENYHSLNQDFPYQFNKLYTNKKALLIERTNGILSIHIGYHSYSSKNKALLDYHLKLTKFLLLVKCIIPKGSDYYYNTIAKEYVSNQIILQEIIK